MEHLNSGFWHKYSVEENTIHTSWETLVIAGLITVINVNTVELKSMTNPMPHQDKIEELLPEYPREV